MLDYDGTVCTTEGRYDPPPPPMADALGRLLEEGMLLGFASGRGPSLHADLRKVIDQAHWPQVHLGLYNGGHIVGLDEELEDLKTPSALIAAVHDRLRELPIAEALDYQARRVQLTVEPADGAWVKPPLLAEAVAEVLHRAPALPVKVVRSGHSLDIVPEATTKVAVVERLTARVEGDILTVGDQGQIGATTSSSSRTRAGRHRPIAARLIRRAAGISETGRSPARRCCCATSRPWSRGETATR